MPFSLIKYFYTRIIYPVIAWYLKKERLYRYKGFNLVISKGIFHPAFFMSTKYLYSFVDRKKLEARKCLELGCGSGLLSLLMLRKGGDVTAVDINERAIENTILNYKRNKIQFKKQLQTIVSDAFGNLNGQKFDFIVINPPYYFAAPANKEEFAWYCGENGEYFKKLFSQLPLHTSINSETYMILAESCDLQRINKIAVENGCCMQLVSKKKILWELNFIYKVLVNEKS